MPRFRTIDRQSQACTCAIVPPAAAMRSAVPGPSVSRIPRAGRRAQTGCVGAAGVRAPSAGSRRRTGSRGAEGASDGTPLAPSSSYRSRSASPGAGTGTENGAGSSAARRSRIPRLSSRRDAADGGTGTVRRGSSKRGVGRGAGSGAGSGAGQAAAARGDRGSSPMPVSDCADAAAGSSRHPPLVRRPSRRQSRRMGARSRSASSADSDAGGAATSATASAPTDSARPPSGGFDTTPAPYGGSGASVAKRRPAPVPRGPRVAMTRSVTFCHVPC